MLGTGSCSAATRKFWYFQNRKQCGAIHVPSFPRNCEGKGEGTPFGGGTSVVAVNATDGTFLWSYRPDTFLYNWIGSIQHLGCLNHGSIGGYIGIMEKNMETT